MIPLVDFGSEAAEDDEPILLQYVNADILGKVLQWCTHHKDDAPQQSHDENGDLWMNELPSWDQEFLRVGQGTLFEILMAANYLDIEGLIDSCCKSVVNVIKGKTPEDIRKTFNIKSQRHPSREGAGNLDELVLYVPIVVLPNFSSSSSRG